MNWYLAVLKNYAGFNGRARRKEYWIFTLINCAFMVALYVVGAAMGTDILYYLYIAAIFIPSLAVTARRLHDTDRSGWWMLIGIVPLIGPITMLIFTAQDGDDTYNKYGENPKPVPVTA